MQEFYVLMNKENKFIVKRYGKMSLSSTNIRDALTYKYMKTVQNLLKDKTYWNYKGINIDEFRLVKMECTFKEVVNESD